MSGKNVVVYISENNSQCKKLMNEMDKWDISYDTKNVTQNTEYMKELQDQGIYGTPATFIEDTREVILGFQKSKIKYALGINSVNFSEFGSSYYNENY
ncbi:hypothetical protein CIL03_09240 [Virgibacillus indicus]|uniref:Glutaredoxin domain-containing protein n=1 Tax=Virgibacillus indicus TaxID=2024554 RepID=A0A265NBI8_9BACI|nr:glutaredoxin family protein [Virgibacillus indicus]OZU89181.1 hypothetical protein CIL03_09240 [Virgibacillus indicus]